jgi:hypothetical protein
MGNRMDEETDEANVEDANTQMYMNQEKKIKY